MRHGDVSESATLCLSKSGRNVFIWWVCICLLWVQSESASSLRERALRLQAEALEQRDKASCVRGAQASFRLRAAEMREKEAARLMALAASAESRDSLDGCCAPPPRSPSSSVGTDVAMLTARDSGLPPAELSSACAADDRAYAREDLPRDDFDVSCIVLPPSWRRVGGWRLRRRVA